MISLEKVIERSVNKIREREILAELFNDLRKQQAALRPKIEKHQEQVWANRRTEGPRGFQMVRPK